MIIQLIEDSKKRKYNNVNFIYFAALNDCTQCKHDERCVLKYKTFGARYFCEPNTDTIAATTATSTTTATPATTTQSKFRIILKVIISSLLEHIVTVLFIYYDFSEPVILTIINVSDLFILFSILLVIGINIF